MAAGHGDRIRSAGDARKRPVCAVFQDEHLLRFDFEPLGRQHVWLRVWLAPHDILSRDDEVESVGQVRDVEHPLGFFEAWTRAAVRSAKLP